MIHVGDITKLNGAELPVVDVITGGSPCQDLSVAGKRAGLAGERSGLFMEQVRIVKEMREHDRSTGRTGYLTRPRYMLWENVPGAFSSNKGEDFRAVLEEIAKVEQEDAHIPRPEGSWPYAGCVMGDGWSIAWRLHDAQFWGVPQRRKRIALVADFGGESAPEILFERKGVSRDIAESGKERQRTAKDVEGCVRETGATFYDAYQHHGWRESDTSGTLTAGQNNGVRGDTPLIAKNIKVIGFNRERCGAVAMDDMMPTLQAAAGESGNNQPMAALSFQERAGKPGGGKGILIQNERTGALSTLNNQSVVYGISAYESNAMKSGNPHSGIYEAETARTLDLNGSSPACNQGGMAVVEPIPINTMVGTRTTDENRTTFGIGSSGDPQFTLSSAHSHAVAVENHPQDSRVKTYAIQRNDEYKESDLAHTQAARDYKSATDLVVSAVDCRNMNESDVSGTLQSKDNGGYSLNYTNPIRTNSIVRRLTPLECERLQGFPDGWTDIGEWTDSKGKMRKCSDSARYKALGNSIAIPFWFYILRRMAAQYERPATLGSLFDGIGGFPLCWERCNGKGTAIWASEVEEFAIAVTKKRFGDR